MNVRVVLFAKPRELVGAPNVDLELPSGATAADAWRQLSDRYALGPLPRAFRCAVNSEYARWEDPLSEGAELAIIPPVSGGAVTERRDVVALSEEPLDPQAIASRVRSDQDGAVVVFQGVVRDVARGRTVRALVYEAYGAMAQRQMEMLAAEAASRFAIGGLAVVHRTGTLQVGEVSVVIAVAAPHRGAAFDACEWLIDELKRTVPIWKKEIYTEGEAWIGDRP
ncbi:MAG TPA: molybdenum cofactor biosynthesis protein MoaE [Candidatus Limnocylindrales bacterium]|nr:molybdenum cofactor biosynthesis protein MoaE [Candidatus Limnocylindrales bacterium]